MMTRSYSEKTKLYFDKVVKEDADTASSSNSSSLSNTDDDTDQKTVAVFNPIITSVACPNECLSVASLQEFKEKTVAAMKCIFCQYMPASPVRTCQSGHVVCSLCYETNKACFICKGQMNVLSPFLESQLRVHEIKIPCHYSKVGCPSSFKFTSNLKTHMDTCYYRVFPCLEPRESSCEGETFNLDSIYDHLKTFHQVEELPEDENVGVIEYLDLDDFAKNRFDDTVHMVKIFDGEIFLSQTRYQDGILHFWVTIIGNETTAAKYRYIWTIKNPKADQSTNPTQEDIKWTYPVVPIHKHCFNDAVELGRVEGNLRMVKICTEYLFSYCTKGVHPVSNKAYDYTWTQTLEIEKVTADSSSLPQYMKHPPSPESLMVD